MSKKEVKKEATVNRNEITETVTYYFDVTCPYCDCGNIIDEETKPKTWGCVDCQKEFSIRYTH